MDQARITLLTRRGIREPRPTVISDDEITEQTLLGVLALALKIKQFEPQYFQGRKSISSYTHEFVLPSDCEQILRVWDMETTALTVSGAANDGTGLIRITTSAAHGLADADIVIVHDVGGTTEANGTWQIDYLLATHGTTMFDLVGSTFANTFTSAGKCFKEVTGKRPMRKIRLQDANGVHNNCWYPRGKNIIVDDFSFTDDIIVDYVKRPSAITDIPSEYHMGLVAFNVLHLLKIPEQTDPTFGDKVAAYGHAKSTYAEVLSSINESFNLSGEPFDFEEAINYDALI